MIILFDGIMGSGMTLSFVLAWVTYDCRGQGGIPHEILVNLGMQDYGAYLDQDEFILRQDCFSKKENDVSVCQIHEDPPSGHNPN